MTLSDDILDELRELMATGQCDGLTIWKSQSGGFQASLRSAKSQGWVMEVDADPVAALALVLKFDVPRTPVKKTEPSKKSKYDDLI